MVTKLTNYIKIVKKPAFILNLTTGLCARETVPVIDEKVIDVRPEEPLADAPEGMPVESEKVEDNVPVKGH